MMKRLLAVCIVLFCAGWTLDAQAGCCPRTPVRTAGHAVREWRPGNLASRVLEKKVLRRALARLVCRDCG